MFVRQPYKSHTPRNKKLVSGVGINDADYPITYTDPSGKKYKCPFYTTWAAMLYRCYDPTFHQRRPTYQGCSVVDDWKTFSNFSRWMQGQNWQGNELDKDLLVPGNKVYGPSTCLFVPSSLNNLLTLRANARGALPLGVSETTINGYKYFVASLSRGGKRVRVGYFKTVEEAEAAYEAAKKDYIRELAIAQTDPVLRQVLLNIC